MAPHQQLNGYTMVHSALGQQNFKAFTPARVAASRQALLYASMPDSSDGTQLWLR